MKPLPMIPNATPPVPESTHTDFAPDAEKTAALKPAIIAAISTVYDPEIPVNIWELGLIYDVAVDAAGAALITMTLTAPGCPAAQSLPSEVGAKARSVSDRTVDSHIRRVRAKLRPFGLDPFETVHGVGFRLGVAP